MALMRKTKQIREKKIREIREIEEVEKIVKFEDKEIIEAVRALRRILSLTYHLANDLGGSPAAAYMTGSFRVHIKSIKESAVFIYSKFKEVLGEDEKIEKYLKLLEEEMW